MIEAYVTQIGHIPPTIQAEQLPGQVVRSLGGHANALGENRWSVALGSGPLSSALVEVQIFGTTSTLRITFTPAAGTVPLGLVSEEPKQWSPGVLLPDSGNVPLMRTWRNLPSRLTVSCSTVTETVPRNPADALIDEIVCFVDRL